MANSKRPFSDDTQVRRTYLGQDIAELIEDISDQDYLQFELISDYNVPTKDSEDGEHFHKTTRILGTNEVTEKVVKSQCILVGNDMTGLSMVLKVPVPPGASLSVTMSTWVNPCHFNSEIHPTACFGVGLIPYGSGKEERWVREGFQTSIGDGVQFYGDFNMSPLMLLSRFARDGMTYTMQTMQNGTCIQRKEGHAAKMTLAPIDLKVVRDSDGNSDITVQHGAKESKIYRAAASEEEDLQLYVNCLGWANNNTYVRFESVAYEPPSAKKAKPVDYNAIMENDAELREKVNNLIEATQQGEEKPETK